VKAYALKFGVPFRQSLKNCFKFGFIWFELCPGRGTTEIIGLSALAVVVR